MKRKMGQQEIDQVVVAQVKDDSAWDKAVHVRKSRTASLTIPSELAARAAFLARLHRQPTTDEWLANVIRDRVELEEAAFAGAKREIGAKGEE